MPRYEKPPVEVTRIIERMMEKYHGPLVEAKVTVDCTLAFATQDEHGDIKSPAVTLGGYKCQAKVKVVNLHDRTLGHGDAEIIIDGDNWPLLSEEECDALIDHELEHIELRVDREGSVVRDDLDRPKLRLRKHDHQFGWFDSIARRHGSASLEVKQFEAFKESHRQLWFEFEEPAEEPKKKSRKREQEPELAHA